MKGGLNTKGFSVIEILVVAFILLAAAAAILPVLFDNQNFLSQTAAEQDKFFQARYNLGAARALGYGDFSALQDRNFSGDLWSEKISTAKIYDYTKKVVSVVQPVNSPVSRPAEIQTFVSDWSESVGASTCFRRLEDVEGYEIIKGFDLQVNSAPTDIDVVRGKAYITIDSSNAPNFLIVDVSDIENPEFMSNNFITGRKINALHIAGRYAFIATGSTALQLQVVDVFNFYLQLVGEYRLPNPSNQVKAASIFYKDKKIYLGAEKDEAGQEFHIIDVSTPSNPRHLGAWEADTKVNDIVVRDNLAFLATPNPSPIKMLNVSNYQSIALADHYGTGEQTHGGQAVSLIDNLLVLGRSISGIEQSNYHELFLFDISQNTLNFTVSKKISTSVQDLLVRENILIVAGSLSENHILQFRSLKSENLLELIKEISLPAKPAALDCENDNLFVVTEQPARLIIVGPAGN